MNKSLFDEIVAKYFPQLVLAIVTKINGKPEAPKYLFKQLLVPKYSPDGRWASILASYNNVAADVVSMDSELPLKSRDAMETASGKLPKLGQKRALQESDLKMLLGLLQSPNPDFNEIAAKIFEDLPSVLTAIFERLEDMFLCGFSTGAALATRNEGTGVRITYGYKTENLFGVKTLWSDGDTSKPLDDIKRVFDKAEADGNAITDMWVDDVWLDAFYKNKQVREQFAFNKNFVGTGVPELDFEQAEYVIKKKYNGTKLHRVNRSIKTEINGVKKNHKPWAKGVCVFVCRDKVGDLVWTDVVESVRPVSGVRYEKTEKYILLSKYSKNDPVREFTSSQAMVAPVINNIDEVYVLNSTETQE